MILNTLAETDVIGSFSILWFEAKTCDIKSTASRHALLCKLGPYLSRMRFY